MSAVHEMKQNDRRPYYRVHLTQTVDGVEEAANITGYSAVKFTMKTGSGSPKVNKQTMTVLDAATGYVQYAWASGDTDTVGDFNVEVEVDWGGGELQTFPSTGYFSVKINTELA